MPPKDKDETEKFEPDVAEQRLKAALQGARIAGPMPKDTVPKKRKKPQPKAETRKKPGK